MMAIMRCGAIKPTFDDCAYIRVWLGATNTLFVKYETTATDLELYFSLRLVHRSP